MIRVLKLNGRTANKYNSKTEVIMFIRKLCPHCQTGRDTYNLDGRSMVCPYLGFHNGKECSMYMKLVKPKGTAFLKNILKKASDREK